MTPRARIHLLFALAALVLFVPGLGAVHLFDWDEINFAEISREMIVLDDYSRVHVGFQPFWEKPPLFFWLQAACMHLFGVGEFAARLPNAVCGVVTLLLLVRIGERLHSLRFGALWALAYLGSVLPHLYFRSGIIDPWFNLFIFLGLYHFILAHWKKDPRAEMPVRRKAATHALLGGAFMGLAMLTKGQVAFMLFALTLGFYWLLLLFPRTRGDRTEPVATLAKWTAPLLLFCASMVLVTGAWFGYETWKNGPWFVTEFIRYQYRLFSTPDAGHAGFPGYHFVVLLIGCFPASVFAVQEMARPTKGTWHQRDMRRWMLVLFWVVLVLFTVVKSKIVHYSSMCYLPLTYLAALQLERVWSRREAFGWPRFLVGGIGSLIAFIVIAVPFLGMRTDLLVPLFAQDPFAQANLEADVTWTGMEASAGLFLLAALLLGHWLHRKGRFRSALIAVFVGTALFVTLTLFFFINRIEGYSQAAAVRFLEARQGERCHVLNMGYRTYTVHFYAREQPLADERAHDEQWLLYGDVDRPVYVLCKVTSAEEVGAIPTLEELYRENGFVFFKRKTP